MRKMLTAVALLSVAFMASPLSAQSTRKCGSDAGCNLAPVLQTDRVAQSTRKCSSDGCGNLAPVPKKDRVAHSTSRKCGSDNCLRPEPSSQAQSTRKCTTSECLAPDTVIPEQGTRRCGTSNGCELSPQPVPPKLSCNTSECNTGSGDRGKLFEAPRIVIACGSSECNSGDRGK
jgi:hypothetical protein